LNVVAPKGWKVENNASRLVVHTGSLFISENCGSRSDLTHVGVRFDVIPSPAPIAFGARPARFTAASGDGLSKGFADTPCGSSSQIIRFVDHGRNVDVYVDFGAKASRADRQAAYRILNSLRPSLPRGAR
jgi:hypothetical protein